MLPSAFQELLNKAAAAKQAGAFPTPTAKPAVNLSNLPEAFQALLNKNKQALAPSATPAPAPTPIQAAPAPVEKAPAKSAEQEEYEKAVAQAKADYIEAMATKSPLASTSKSAYEKTVEYTPEKKAAEAKQKQIEEQQAIAAKKRADKIAEFKKLVQAGVEKKQAQQAQKSSFLAGKNKPALLQMKSLFEKMGLPVSPQLQAAIDAPVEEEVKPVFNPFSQNPAFKDFLSYK